MAKENYKRTGNGSRKERTKSQPGGSLHFGLKMNQQDWRKADHNGSTDVSTTPLPEALDTNHHVYRTNGVSIFIDYSTAPRNT
jgi:hypothetical protein